MSQLQARTVTPILAVEDISATLAFYRDVIGATNTWEWETPPVYGGCSLGTAHVHFSLNPELAPRSRGQSMFVNVSQIDELYQQHLSAGAKIVNELEPKPWGVKEYTLEDCNGVLLRFAEAGFLTPRREPRDDVAIVPRRMTTQEFRELLISVNWTFDDREESLRKSIEEPVFAVTAEHEGRCIGTGSILGHETGNYLIFNVIVHPDFQSQGVGKQIMRGLDDWLTENGVPGAMVKLFTGLDRQDFYGQFGFTGPEMGLVGMTKSLPKS